MKPLAIIPTYLTAGPGLQVLFTCLESLRKTAGDALDVLIVDDCSPDQDLVAALRSRSDELGFDLIQRPENGGYSRTVNPGLARALGEGRDAVLVNADIEFLDSGWLQLAQNAKTDDGRVGSVVGARLIFPNGTLQHGGVMFSHLHRVFEHRYRYAPHDLPEALVACEAPVTGALQFIRYDCLAEVGLYDERYRMGWEDVDYCIRTWQAGRACIYEPAIRAIHHESFFRGEQTEKLQRWTAESWFAFCDKYRDQSFAAFVPSIA